MNSSVVLPNLWRFLVLVAVQVFILPEVALTADGEFNILLYPLFILFLPVKLATPVVVFLGFLTGLIVDLFAGTIGVNASAGALSGYARAILLHKYSPKGGLVGKDPIPSPEYFGWRWFLIVSTIFFGAHILWYFSMAYFTPVYLFQKILPQAILSWIMTMLVVLVLTRLFHPKV